MSLLEIIKKTIQKKGPLNVADYMALALSHPEHGYYMKKDPLGREGDFTTAPEVSQIFGELIGLWLTEQWRIAGHPEMALVELGPGRGTLMNDILRASKMVQGFHDAIKVHLVETSPTLKQKQWKNLAGKHACLEWHDSIASLPAKPLLLVANEFFDALPIRQFAGDSERMITVSEQGTLEFSVPDEYITAERCESATAIMATIAQHIETHGGVALIIDYGYEHGSGDSLQAIKQHSTHNPLETPGEADLTAHVDFGALRKAALAYQVDVHGPRAQGAFLGQLGAIERAMQLCSHANETHQSQIMSGLTRLVSPEAMGELFRVMTIVPRNYPVPEGF
ncbi:MAG: SAM-dependent methyltransferase [Rickettsiales bacterium]|nr:SAM-dependent methyltransferase [Rickettsiales bacterium]